MSDPRPLAERLDAALTFAVLRKAAEAWLQHGTEAMRAVLTSALLAALEESQDDEIASILAGVTDDDLDALADRLAAEGPTPAPGDAKHMTFSEAKQRARQVLVESDARRDAALEANSAPPDDTLARVAPDWIRDYTSGCCDAALTEYRRKDGTTGLSCLSCSEQVRAIIKRAVRPDAPRETP